MPREIPGGRGGTIRPREKGDPALNPHGRPRKLVTLMKGVGYNESDVRITMQNMLGLTKDQLKSIIDNPDSTILEITVASALAKSIKKGSMLTLESVLSRAIDKPINEMQKIDANIKLNIDPVEAAKEYQKIMSGQA